MRPLVWIPPLIAGLCVLVLGPRVASRRAAAGLAARLAELERDGLLFSSGRTPLWDEPDARAALADLRALGERVERTCGTGWVESLGTPGAPAPDLEALSAERAALAAWLERPVVRRALERGEVLAGSSIHARSLRQVLGLALLEALYYDGAGAPAAFARALDVLWLADDGSLLSIVGREQLERRLVLPALQRLVERPDVDARRLAAELDPRLARLADPRRAWDAGRHELEFLVRGVAPLGAQELTLSQWLFGVEEPEVSVRTACAMIDAERAVLERQGPPCLDVAARLAGLDLEVAFVEKCARALALAEDRGHVSLRRLELARVALALRAQRAEHGTWPARLEDALDPWGARPPCDPCAQRRPVWAGAPGPGDARVLAWGPALHAPDPHGPAGPADPTMRWVLRPDPGPGAR